MVDTPLAGVPCPGSPRAASPPSPLSLSSGLFLSKLKSPGPSVWPTHHGGHTPALDLQGQPPLYLSTFPFFRLLLSKLRTPGPSVWPKPPTPALDLRGIP